MPQIEASHARANLMTLPAELRNRIYEFVLVADDGIECPDGSHTIECAEPSEESSWKGHEEYMPAYFGTLTWCTQPPLTRVCRELRAETLTAYYGLNAFVVYVEGSDDWSNLNGSEAWFSRLPAQTHRLIKNLHVRFCVNSSETGLPGRRMARVAQKLGLDVSEAAVTTWVGSEMTYTGHGEYDNWNRVVDVDGEEVQRKYDEVEKGFDPAIREAAQYKKRELRYEWV